MNRRMLICAFTGFASGLPFFIILQLIPAWLRVEQVSLKDIGFFALVQTPYLFKFLWAPFLDRYSLPFLGRRRGWMLLTQVMLLISVAYLGGYRPDQNLAEIMWLSGLVALFSATQDIVLDAYRRELLPDLELGLGNQIHVQTYRIAGLIPGTLGLILADHLSWDLVFLIVALFMLVGIAMTLAISEAVACPKHPRTLVEALRAPLSEFVERKGVSGALLVLLFLFAYKLGDSMATALSTPFYIDLGFSLTEIGLIAKNAALWPSVIGGLLGGLLMLKIGINKALWIFGGVQLVTILGFALLAKIGSDPLALAVVISLEYLGVGLGAAAFVAFIARESSPALAATQIALFTAITALPRTLASTLTGFLVEGGDPALMEGATAIVMRGLMLLGLPQSGLGWSGFFYLCTLLALPGMCLLHWVAPFSAGVGEGDSADPAPGRH